METFSFIELSLHFGIQTNQNDSVRQKPDFFIGKNHFFRGWRNKITLPRCGLFAFLCWKR